MPRFMGFVRMVEGQQGMPPQALMDAMDAYIGENAAKGVFLDGGGLFGTEDARLREEDIVNRRRSWTWRFYFRLAIFIAGFLTIIFLIRYAEAAPGTSVTWWGSASTIFTKLFSFVKSTLMAPPRHPCEPKH